MKKPLFLMVLALALTFALSACTTSAVVTPTPRPTYTPVSTPESTPETPPEPSPEATPAASAEPSDAPSPESGEPAGEPAESTPTPASIQSGLEVGNRAPDFEIKTLGGSTKVLSDLRGTKPVLINFWATWCDPSTVELPALQSLYSRYGDSVEFVILNSGEEEAAVSDYMSGSGFTFPAALDETGAISEKYNAVAIPRTYILDMNGVIRSVLKGSQSERSFITEIEAVMAG